AATAVNTVIIIAVCGAIGGFLFFNWHPSRMYMGDTGSQLLGVLLAYVGMRYFWNGTSLTGTVEPWRQVAVTLVIFILPLADTATVSINRMLRGTSPFIRGKDPTFHYLRYAGLTDSQVAMAFGGRGVLSCFLGFIALRFIPEWEPLHTALYLGYAAVIFLFLFGLTKRRGIERPL